MTATRRGSRAPKKAPDMLHQDVASMLKETGRILGVEAEELAHDLIVVVRERTLREIESYARENVR